jgi:predicted RNA-binding protein YlqC (UPF0109 family)
VKELVLMIARALVDMPEKVTVSEVQGSQCTVLELKVEKSEIGKVIGKQGRTAQAMRTILSAASAKLKRRAVLEIVETAEADRYTRQRPSEASTASPSPREPGPTLVRRWKPRVADSAGSSGYNWRGGLNGKKPGL